MNEWMNIIYLCHGRNLRCEWMNVTYFILAWPENDSRYNTGVNTPRASLRVTMYVTLWVIIFWGIILCIADNLDNPLVTTGLEQLLLSVLPKDTYVHNGSNDEPWTHYLWVRGRRANQLCYGARQIYFNLVSHLLPHCSFVCFYCQTLKGLLLIQ